MIGDLEPELEGRLKLEALRRGQSMAEVLREALWWYLGRGVSEPPPGAGEFASGHDDTAERAEEALAETGFGEPRAGDGPPPVGGAGGARGS